MVRFCKSGAPCIRPLFRPGALVSRIWFRTGVVGTTVTWDYDINDPLSDWTGVNVTMRTAAMRRPPRSFLLQLECLTIIQALVTKWEKVRLHKRKPSRKIDYQEAGELVE